MMLSLEHSLGLVALLVFYISYTIIYRWYFHPLARFPGPKFAAATKWYEAYFDLVKRPGGTFMYEIERMHEIYGPIVRINPDELHVKDSAWAETLYCGPAFGMRDKYAPAAHMAGTPKGIFGTVPHDIHRKRRMAISPFFSKASIKEFEPRIYDKVALLEEKLNHQLSKEGNAEMRVNYLALTTDTLCSQSFNASLDLLKSEKGAVNWQKTIHAIAILTPLVKQFTWIIPVALKVPLVLLQLAVPDLARIVKLREDMHEHAEAAISNDNSCIKNESWNFNDQASKGTSKKPENIFHSMLSSRHLPPKEKERNRIAQDGFVVIVAGGETTGRVLTSATYHVLANKANVLPRLKEELESVMPDPYSQVDVSVLEKLPWLTAIVKESLRITALVTSRLPLVSPNEVLRYKDWVIPPGTPVSMTLRDMLLDPTIFKDATEFRPERWLPSNPDLEKISRAYLPFGRGSRMCVGVNLALAELYITIACLFRRFDLELYDTVRTRDIDVVRDCFIGESSPQTKGVRISFAKES